MEKRTGTGGRARRVKRGCGVVTVVALCACAAVTRTPSWLPPADLPAQIERWETTARDPGRAAEAYRHLFLLYSHPDQTAPDYERSATALDSLVQLDPAASDEYEVRRWMGVYSALREARAGSRKEREENGALRAEIRELKKNLSDERREAQEAKEAVAALSKEKRELLETLEKLKELDLQMERLRRSR